jgi:hypothetical protein
MITEPATMLTDYLLSLVSLFFFFRLRQSDRFQSEISVRLWAIGFLLSALAATVGGTFHGFALYFSASTSKALWNITVFLLGSCSAFMVAGTLTASIDRRSATAKWLLTGLAFSMAGLILLASGLALHKHFNHNDIYHSVQVFGLYFFYRGVLLLRDRA